MNRSLNAWANKLKKKGKTARQKRSTKKTKSQKNNEIKNKKGSRMKQSSEGESDDCTA